MKDGSVRVAVWILLLTAISGCFATWRPTSRAYLPQISADAGALSWEGLALETTRAQVERRLGKQLDVRPHDAPACGAWSSTVEVGGSQAVLQWSDPTDQGQLESIAFALTRAEVSESAISLANRAATREHGVEVDPLSGPSGASLHLRSRPSHVLLIKAGREAIAFLSLEACLD